MTATSTQEVGLKLVNKADPSSLDIHILQLRDIGLKITLQSVAENAANRLVKLTRLVEILENELFSEDAFKNLTDASKLERYQLLINVTTSLSGQVKNNAPNVDWAQLQIRLDTILKTLPAVSDSSSTDKNQLTSMAADLLNEISSLNTK